ncbi:hypothetical protein BC829DRAFT_403929 [Chytridium lagenaria]|nr:hypothetical protein BC829DRAFT_403929 [Chytridium lagenaria]
MAAHYHHHQHHPTHTHTTTPTTITTLQLEPSAWNHRISTLFCCCYTVPASRVMEPRQPPPDPPPQQEQDKDPTSPPPSTPMGHPTRSHPTLHAERLQIINTYMNTLLQSHTKDHLHVCSHDLDPWTCVVFVLSAQREREMDGIGRRGGEYNTVMGVFVVVVVVTIMGFILRRSRLLIMYVSISLDTKRMERSRSRLLHLQQPSNIMARLPRRSESLSYPSPSHDDHGRSIRCRSIPRSADACRRRLPSLWAQHAAVFMTASNTPQHVPCGSYGMQLEQQQYLPPYSGPSTTTQQPPKYA